MRYPIAWFLLYSVNHLCGLPLNVSPRVDGVWVLVVGVRMSGSRCCVSDDIIDPNMLFARGVLVYEPL